jgi:hypothetical protein
MHTTTSYYIILLHHTTYATSYACNHNFQSRTRTYLLSAYLQSITHACTQAYCMLLYKEAYRRVLHVFTTHAYRRVLHVFTTHAYRRVLHVSTTHAFKWVMSHKQILELALVYRVVTAHRTSSECLWCVWCDAFVLVPWRTHVTLSQRIALRMSACMRVTWLIRMCDMTHPHDFDTAHGTLSGRFHFVWHDAFMHDMTCLYVWHDSVMCVTW